MGHTIFVSRDSIHKRKGILVNLITIFGNGEFSQISSSFAYNTNLVRFPMKIKAFGWHVHMHTYIIVVSFSRFMFSSAIWLCNGPPLSSKFRQAKHWKEKFCEWIDSSNSLDGVGLEKRTCEGMVSQPPWIRQIMEYVIGPNKEGTEAEISFYVIMRKRELLVSDSFYVFSCAFYTVGLDFRWDCTSNEK